MEKINKNFQKVECNTPASENAEKQRLELVSKLSGAVLYNLLRVKDQTTTRAVQSLNGAMNCYANAYSNIQKLASVTDEVMGYKLSMDCIREEFSLKSIKNDPYMVCIDENKLSESIKDELGEHSWPIAKVLLEVSRGAYGKMGGEEAIIAAKKIISATQTQSDILNFSHVVEKALSAAEALKNNLADFINEYASLKEGIKEISIRSIVQKGIGEGHEAILRTASEIVAEHIANEEVPSWPKIIMERSISGKDIGMAMHFRGSSSYFAIVYLKLSDYDTINKFVEQLGYAIKEQESTADPKAGVPKLSIKTYSDIRVCMVGAANFNPVFEATVKENIQRLFGGK